MSKNLINRIITSAILLAILLAVNYNHHYFFIISLTIIGIIICIEANNIYSKLVGPLFIKNDKKDHIIKFNMFNNTN